MKRFLYTVLALSAFGLSSCKKFLDKFPTDNASPQVYFKDETGVNTALAGVYDVLGKSGTYGRTLYFELDMSDESFNALTTQTVDLSLNNYDPSDEKVRNLWNFLYEGVNRANMFLANIDSKDLVLDDEKRNVAKGEALFLRAYYYFMLVSNWGDVPVRLTPTAYNESVHYPRTPAKTVYNLIIKDMEAAAKMVGSIKTYGHSGRITKSAVWGILARVNLKMAGEPLLDRTRFEDARRWADSVMQTTNGHALNPDYSQVFINQCQDKYDIKESIWEVEFNKLSTGGQEEEGSLGSITGIANGDRSMFSYGAVHATERYFRLFDTTDLRRDWSISPYSYITANGITTGKRPYTAAEIYNRYNAKWKREFEIAFPKSLGTTPINFPLLRYSDVLLMFAEAENEVNGPTAEAYDAINQVRKRAYGLLLPTPPRPGVVSDLPPGMDAVDFRLALQKERSLELGFEGLRRFDLIRWGTYLSTMRSLSYEIKNSAPAGYKYAGRTADNTTERHLLLPIPSLEFSLNKALVQNNNW